MDSGIWLPPQRTFSSIADGRPLEAERANHLEVEVERDIASATVSLRAFRQHVSDQIVTLFGVNMPDAPRPRTLFHRQRRRRRCHRPQRRRPRRDRRRMHGSVEYSTARAQRHVAGPRVHAGARSVGVAPGPSTFTMSSTSIETEVPETSTRVVVLYRVSNAFARQAESQSSRARRSTSALTCRFGSRCRSWISATPSGKCWSRSAISSAKPPRISPSMTSCSSFVRPSASSAA